MLRIKPYYANSEFRIKLVESLEKAPEMTLPKLVMLLIHHCGTLRKLETLSGVSRSTWDNILTGNTVYPAPATLQKIAELLNNVQVPVKDQKGDLIKYTWIELQGLAQNAKEAVEKQKIPVSPKHLEKRQAQIEKQRLRLGQAEAELQSLINKQH